MRWLALPSTYIVLPMLVACALTWLTYDVPPEYLEGLVWLVVSSLALAAADGIRGTRRMDWPALRSMHFAGTREGLVALAFAGAIAVFCFIDLVFFPIPLFDEPAAYASMAGGREHIRHVSDMCWVLVPIAMLCTDRRPLRWSLLALGFAFPILVIDRNRLFAALCALGLLMLLRRDRSRRLPWGRGLVLLVGGAATFSVLGIVRSGTLDYVTLPFDDLYRASPPGIKWLLLYATAGPYNFSAILAKGYTNASFLVNQLVPLAGSVATAGTDIPLDAKNINVGTEYFPFLMAWGAGGALLSMGLLYGMLAWSMRRLRDGVSLFALLIFLRMAYVCLMAPFAPQAFTWTNFGFIALCLLMQWLAWLLPVRSNGHGDRVATFG